MAFVTFHTGKTHIEIVGRFDASDKTTLLHLMENGSTEIVLDLTRAVGIDASLVGLVVMLNQRAASLNVKASPSARRMIEGLAGGKKLSFV